MTEQPGVDPTRSDEDIGLAADRLIDAIAFHGRLAILTALVVGTSTGLFVSLLLSDTGTGYLACVALIFALYLAWRVRRFTL